MSGGGRRQRLKGLGFNAMSMECSATSGYKLRILTETPAKRSMNVLNGSSSPWDGQGGGCDVMRSARCILRRESPYQSGETVDRLSRELGVPIECSPLERAQYGRTEQWQKAIGFYTEAIKLCGDNATYYSNRAQAYLELGSFLQAETDCTKAIGLDKQNVKAYFRRGTAREMLGYYKEAIDDFKHALVLEPTNKRAAAAVERLRKLFQ
ncbi:uncharacterized protein LOC109799479 [Cajanus cajan]|uniref:uncharacterized protein LOC109799479 n=1 Tax=Cajanus cajan TaxID=3821 RepID=UPI00098D8BEB|nr:uncharacterized protein LOC109799479 [Cajanus cajan]